VLAQPGVAEAIGENLEEAAESVAAWLAALSLLEPVPFSYLVPDPRMLPVESIRFFYVDQGWIDALLAGATSIAVHGSADVEMLRALRPQLDRAVATERRRLLARGPSSAAAALGAGGTGMSGVLIRSQLVSGWPALVVGATLGGAPVPIARDDLPSPSVRLTLFQGVPDEVTLAEPYQGLQFGVEDEGVYARCVTATAVTGAQIANVAPVAPTLRTPATGAIGGVLELGTLAAALQSAAGVAPFDQQAVVKWNGTALATTYVSGSQLTATVPAGSLVAAGTAEVTVLSDGATSSAATFAIDPALAIDELVPFSAAAGSGDLTLAVYGHGFGTGAVVKWDGTPLSTTVISVFEATATVPAASLASIGSHTVAVTSDGVTSDGVPFAVVGPEPAIASIAPAAATAGGAGFTLTVTGSGFDPAAVVDWNGSALATAFKSANELTAEVPATLIEAQATATVTVVAGAETSNGVDFTIAGAAPTIGSLEPAAAMAGGADLQLTVDGVNFATGATVDWNGTALATVFDDAEQLTATVPAAQIATAGQASVTVTSGNQTSAAAGFTVLGPQPAIGLLEPSSAVAGSADVELTVTAGFGPADFALQMVKAPEKQPFVPE
jgi:hypothetical protein